MEMQRWKPFDVKATSRVERGKPLNPIIPGNYTSHDYGVLKINLLGTFLHVFIKKNYLYNYAQSCNIKCF